VTDFYQGIVAEYLRADRAVFVNTECLIQLHPDRPDPHWYCDVLAVDFRAETVFPCEVSYAANLGAMLKRLKAWFANWADFRAALRRDCSLPVQWPVRPWLFVPEECVPRAVHHFHSLAAIPGSDNPPVPRITTLEAVTPWRYCTWDRHGEADKPDSIPPAMR
jgi:hypothetical protein